MNIIITGGTGFIGSYLVNHFVKQGHKVVIFDRFNYASDMRRINSPAEIVFCDLRAPLTDLHIRYIDRSHIVLHLAASTHVDRSIEDPLSFVYDNVLGTAHLLEAVRKVKQKLLYFSTDEVFGPAPEGTNYKEWDRYNSGNPYAATKAGAEELCLAYANTYNLHIGITHCMNVYGAGQNQEKFIPLCFEKCRIGEEVLIHADKECKQSGSRYWIHALDVCSAIDFLLNVQFTKGQKYNIVGAEELTNEEVYLKIAKQVGCKPNYKLVDYHSSRPGHDLRYALDGSKMAELGWTPSISFDEGLTLM